MHHACGVQCAQKSAPHRDTEITLIVHIDGDITAGHQAEAGQEDQKRQHQHDTGEQADTEKDFLHA